MWSHLLRVQKAAQPMALHPNRPSHENSRRPLHNAPHSGHRIEMVRTRRWKGDSDVQFLCCATQTTLATCRSAFRRWRQLTKRRPAPVRTQPGPGLSTSDVLSALVCGARQQKGKRDLSNAIRRPAHAPVDAYPGTQLAKAQYLWPVSGSKSAAPYEAAGQVSGNTGF